MAGPDRWLVVSLEVPDPELREMAAALLADETGRGTREDGDRIEVHLPPPDSEPQEVAAALAGRVGRALPGGALAGIAWRWQPDEDWLARWRVGLGPRRVGGVVVCPTWTHPEEGGPAVTVRIDPGMAFGTGEHATTRGCLRLLQRHLRRGDRVLDIGTGSGILAITALLLGAARAEGLDPDPEAVRTARENATANGVADRFGVREATADAGMLRGLPTYDLVVANILSRVVVGLLSGMVAVTRGAEAPRLLVSGILDEEADEVREAAAGAGLRVADTDLEQGWWSALLLPLTERVDA